MAEESFCNRRVYRAKGRSDLSVVPPAPEKTPSAKYSSKRPRSRILETRISPPSSNYLVFDPEDEEDARRHRIRARERQWGNEMAYEWDKERRGSLYDLLHFIQQDGLELSADIISGIRMYYCGSTGTNTDPEAPSEI